MIRNRDDADVGRSLRAFRHHAEVARRELSKARARLARGHEHRRLTDGRPVRLHE